MFGQPAEEEWQYETTGQTEATNRLLYVAETGQTLAVLEGPYGTGKTSVLRQTGRQLDRAGWGIVYRNLASLDCRAALWQLAGALSVSTGSDVDASRLMVQIREELLARTACRRRLAILLDDVDLSLGDMSVVLHLLTAVAEASAEHLSVIAAVESPPAADIRKRNAMSIVLHSLEEPESIAMATAYLRQLECRVERITDTGLRAIADHAAGLPGRLIRLCQIIQTIMSVQPGPVDAAMVHDAACELLPGQAA